MIQNVPLDPTNCVSFINISNYYSIPICNGYISRLLQLFDLVFSTEHICFVRADAAGAAPGSDVVVSSDDRVAVMLGVSAV